MSRVELQVPDEFELDVRTVDFGFAGGMPVGARSIDEPDCRRTLAARCSEQDECTFGECGGEMTRPVTDCGCPPQPEPTQGGGSCPPRTCEEPCEFPDPQDPDPEPDDPQPK